MYLKLLNKTNFVSITCEKTQWVTSLEDVMECYNNTIELEYYKP